MHGPTTLAILLTAALPAAAQLERTLGPEGNGRPVVLTVTPPEPTEAYSVEEVVTGSALPTGISDGGTYDSASTTIRWGPFLDATPRTLGYRLVGPAGAVSLEARVNFDGVDSSTDQASLTLPAPEGHLLGEDYLERDPVDLVRFALDPAAEGDTGRTIFAAYALVPTGPDVSISLDRIAGTATIRARVPTGLEDVDYQVEASRDLENWEPLATVLPDATLTRRETDPGQNGIDVLVYEAVPLVTPGTVAVRLSADWALADPE